MKRMLLVSLVGLYLPVVLGSSDQKAELAVFLQTGDVRSMLAEKGVDETLTLLKNWEAAWNSSKEFSAYYNVANADQTTVLGKFIGCEDARAAKIIEYLVDFCDAQLDVGPPGKTPRALLENNPIKDQYSYIIDTKERLKRLVVGFSRAEHSSEKVIEFVDQSSIAIDEVIFSDEQRVDTFLVGLPASPERNKLMAHCASYMKDHHLALTYLIVGCCECSEENVPLALLRSFMSEHPNLEKRAFVGVFELYVGKSFAEYFNESDLAKLRYKEVYDALGAYFVPADSAHPDTLWVTSVAEDADVAKLLVDCATTDLRDAELKNYLQTRDEVLYLDTLPYEGYGSFEEYFRSLNDGTYPRKKVVINYITEHLFTHLLRPDVDSDSLDDTEYFVQHVKDYGVDIDKAPYQGITIGAYANNVDNKCAELNMINMSLQSYRSKPVNRERLLKCLERALRGEDAGFIELKFCLADEGLNVDLIVTDADQIVAKYLEGSPNGATILALPGISSYRNDALSFKCWLEEALSDDTCLPTFANACAAYQYDVDTLLHAQEKTVGQFISEQIGTDRKENALAIARLVQGYRSDKEEIARLLFTPIEKGGNTDDFTKWCTAFPKLDLNFIYHDPSDPADTDTLGSIIDAKYHALAKSLGRTGGPGNPKDMGKKIGWSTGQKFGGFALLVGAGIGYYYLTQKDPTKTNDKNTAAAA